MNPIQPEKEASVKSDKKLGSALVIAGMTIVIIGAFVFAFTRTDQFVENLPAGPGKDVLLEACSGCHTVQHVLKTGRTYQGWEAALGWMQKMHGMGPLSEQDKTALLEYLSENFQPPSTDEF